MRKINLTRLFTVISLFRKVYGTHRPYYDWFTGENLEELNGKLSDLSCPKGHYRMTEKPGGLRSEGCIPCPKGTYSERTDLVDVSECIDCPLGTYRDHKGGKGPAACSPCPIGTYGEETGLTSPKCSGKCTDWNTDEIQYYSNIYGLTTRGNCKICPYGYAGHQCRHELKINRQSTFPTLY